MVVVVGDVKQSDLSEPRAPQLYIPYAQEPSERLISVVRGANPAALLQPMREAVRRVDPTLSLHRFGTMTGKVAEPVTVPRFFAMLAGIAVVALVACWLPARRAAELDPALTLRAD